MVQLSHLYMTTGKTTARLCDLTKRRPGERWTSSCATGGAILNSTLTEGWGGVGMEVPQAQPAFRMRRAQKEMLTPVSNKRPQPRTHRLRRAAVGPPKGAAASCPTVSAALLNPWLLLPQLLAEDSSPRWKTLVIACFPGPKNVDRRLWQRSIKEPKAGSSLPISLPSLNTVREQTTSSFPTRQEK